MIYKWQRYNWWIICIIITLVVFSILYYVHPNECPEDARYILSAISQGLAAILALVFTITLVVSQMTRRYTAMDKIIFRPETILLMIVFGIGVVTPLLVLKFGFFRLGTSLSIALAFFCVFSLLPFLKGVNGVLKYDIGIVNLDEEIVEAIERGDKTKAVNKIRELNEMGESAVREYREDAISLISRVLSRVGIGSAKEKLWYVTYQVVCILNNIGVKSVKKGFEDNSAIDGLRMIADETLTDEVGGDFKSAVIVKVLKGLSDIGVKSAEKGLKNIMADAAEHLTHVGQKSGNNKAVIWLWCMGAAVTKYMPEDVDNVIRSIEELEETISEDKVQSAESRCIENYPNLKDSFEKFKSQCNK